MLGEIAEFRNRARVGAEQHRIKLIGPDGKPIYSGLFDGVTLARLPSNSDQIYIAGSHPGEESISETVRLNKKARTTLQGSIERGEGKLVRL